MRLRKASPRSEKALIPPGRVREALGGTGAQTPCTRGRYRGQLHEWQLQWKKRYAVLSRRRVRQNQDKLELWS